MREPARDVLPGADALEVLDLARASASRSSSIVLNASPSSAISSLAAQLDARIEVAVGDLARGLRRARSIRRVTSVDAPMPNATAASPASAIITKNARAIALGQRVADLRDDLARGIDRAT